MGQSSLGWLKALFALSKPQHLGAGKAMGITQWWFICVTAFLPACPVRSCGYTPGWEIHIHTLLSKSSALLCPCLLHGTLQTLPAGAWEAAGFPDRERSAPAGLRHCPTPCTRTGLPSWNWGAHTDTWASPATKKLQFPIFRTCINH